MARKSARALAAAESNQSDGEATLVASSSKVSLSDLSPKACLTCGRVITPRAKWAKDWDGIKYCSDRCRITRPGKVVARFLPENDLSSLGRYIGVNVKGHREEIHVDVETLIEALLLDISGKNGGGTLEDVQDQLKTILRDASIPIAAESIGSKFGASDAESGDEKVEKNKADVDGNNAIHPLWKALNSTPGLRERIRRAARRLALGINHDSDPKQTNITTTDQGSIQLVLGKKTLRTVEDLSFAKGVIHIKRKGSR
ncbi:uncharacterized protein MEPE_01824 [Melanopsichium pennsylvanicum]|uniref:Uncharacterized protein n=2 Tax=Melanopsichium pennsylvanicum TaxID=63383 RepID=A0AAJ4XJ72_9BASI|nr:putative protein [Melanopsichium pennsylvanicum 4]SNX83118.1 uncharacterized protein MEPE_01824 [Melanopsichium pennsylvanicum]